MILIGHTYVIRFGIKCLYFKNNADRLPVHSSMLTMDRNLGSDRLSHWQIRTLDQDYHLKVDEWTDFLPWTVHLMDEFGRWTKKIIFRWTIGRIFDSMDGFGRQMIIISTRWMEADQWTGRRMKQTGRWTGDPLTIFRGDYIQLTV